jgi:20S proteasome subunit beta 6
VGTEEGVIIVADTRLSRGYTCIARNESKIHNLGGENYMLSTGCHADVRNLWKRLDENATQYEFKMGRKLSLSATANLLSRTLYGARFFPYLSYNMLAGLDENGRGVVFNYDVVGSYESSNYFCGGTSQELIIPVLDTIFLGKFSPKPKIN